MKWTVGIALFLLLAGGVARGQAAEDPLPDEAREFLAKLRTAGWTGHMVAGGVDATARMAPIGSAGMIAAIRAGDAVDKESRKALADVVRVTLSEDGWFLRTPVEAGAYRLGLSFAGDNPEMVLFDATGRRLAGRSFWIHGTTDANLGCSIGSTGGSTVVMLKAGGIELNYRFVPKASHDALVSDLPVATAGPVRIHSDLDAAAELEKLARLAAKTIGAQAKLLGREPPEGPFDVYLFAKVEDYEAADLLLTGGDFKSAWAFSSEITRSSYLHYGPMHDATAFADHGFPLKSRSLVLHELDHQIVTRTLPFGAGTLPDWLGEGLAELGAERALAAGDRADGEAFHALMLGNWLHADRTGAVPPLEDLAGGYMKSGRSAFYTTAYLVVREMARKPKLLRELIDTVGRERVGLDASVRAREEAARLYGGLGTVLDDAARRARGTKRAPPAVTHGTADRIDDAWRIDSFPENQARLMFPAPVESPDGVTIRTWFSFHPSGQQQLDVYLCHREGRHTEQFLKVAILPKKMVLFWFRHGDWRTCGVVNYDKALEIGTAAERTWHPLTVTYRAGERKVRVETTGGRWAEFEVPGFVPCAGTRVGVGAYSGIAYVKDVEVR